jgi:predicted dehydrogenase
VAVQDVAAERRREAEATYGVRSFHTFGAMLCNAELDAVTIATPTHLHARMAIAALRAGCHVMLEKPMTRTAREAERVVRAAARERRVLTVFQSVRAAAYCQHLQSILDSGIIGRLYHIRICNHRYVRRDDWQSLARYGGGMLMNYGAHVLDQVLQLVGYDVARVFCERRVVASLGDAEDVVKILLVTRDGCMAEIDINQASPAAVPPVQAWGTEGTLELSADRDSFVVTRVSPRDLPPKELNASLASADRLYPHEDIQLGKETIAVDEGRALDLYAGFASAILRGTPPFVKPEEPLAVMRLIEKCRRDSGPARRFRAPD